MAAANPAVATRAAAAPLPPGRRWFHGALRRLLGMLAFAAPLAAGQAADPGDEIAAELASFTVADGFTVQLWASEPAVVNPVQINIDHRGRLWAACLPTYPHLYPEQRPLDRVVVLADADGDGSAERADDFASGLLMPNGVLPGDGGCYLACRGELLHLADSDGDGKADCRRVLLAGFGAQDTHHTLNSLRWGRDGRVYANQGIYIHSHVETAWGVRDHVGGAVWGYDPRAQRLELASTTIASTNTWGHAVDAWGRSFATVAWPAGIHVLWPGLGASGLGKVAAAANVGPLRHCGAEIIAGDALGEQMRGVLVTGDFKNRRVQCFAAADSDGAVAWKALPPLLTSTHPAFRPVDVKQGLDGALYVSDWYNRIINHAEVDFRDPRRDRSHGRIWRIARKGAAPAPAPDLSAPALSELLALSRSGPEWQRQGARLALRERPAAAVAAALPAFAAVSAAGDEAGRLEALWTLQHCGASDLPLLTAACAAADERVRAAAVRVAAAWRPALPQARALIAAAAGDGAARVRFEAALALGGDDRVEAAAALAAILDRPSTPPIELAVRGGLVRMAPLWRGQATAFAEARHRDLAEASVKQFLPPGAPR